MTPALSQAADPLTTPYSRRAWRGVLLAALALRLAACAVPAETTDAAARPDAITARDAPAIDPRDGATDGASPDAASPDDVPLAPDDAVADGAPRCASGQRVCGGTCVDTATDPANCGGCDVACSTEQVCAAGACVCPPGAMPCGGRCVDLASDAANCGACGHACATGEACVGMRCTLACPTGLSNCGGACRDLATDRANCGACGTACASGQECTAGRCACPTGQVLCSGACTVPASSGGCPSTSTTTRRVAVIMLLPRNYGTQWITPTAVRNVVWAGPRSVRDYYAEVSYGRWAIASNVRADGDVFGWYTVPYDNDGRCVPFTWLTAARTAAAADGFVASAYNSVIYVTAATGCPGRAWASGSTVFVLNGFNTGTVAHELGHTFGLDHASSWTCRDAAGTPVTISPTCSATEYGDFALMGATTTFHMNGYHKGCLGFLAPSNTRDVTVDGTYTIAPLETPTTQPQVLRIPRTMSSTGSVTDYYYLEFRQPFGFDSFAPTDPRVNGVLIRVAPPYRSFSNHSYLLDATMPGATGFNDAAIAVGSTFTDRTRNVTVTVVSVGSSGAQVRVHFGP